MKIKTTKQMRLDELIKHGTEQNWESVQAISDHGKEVYFTSDRNFIICGDYEGDKRISLDATFTLEVEEELTEETNIGEYGRLIMIHRDSDKESLLYCDYVPTQTIKLTREMHERKYNLETIGLLTEKAELITVWSKDTGIPAEGVIEI